jgi:hypothetical protein
MTNLPNILFIMSFASVVAALAGRLRYIPCATIATKA